MKTCKTNRKILQNTLLIASIFATTLSHSGVVANGTRIIFEGGQLEKTIQLNNKDQHPNLVQMWADQGEVDSTPETANAPFMANPQIFKMNPQQGQIVRLKLLTDPATLPQDQESLFYLNINEIPAMKAQDLSANRLVVSFTNRLKILYRPKGIQGQSADVPQKISYKVEDGQVRLSNPTSYYAHIAEIKMTQNGHVIKQDKSLLIAPNQHFNWSVNTKNSSTNTEVSAVFINDYGSRVTSTLKPE